MIRMSGKRGFTLIELLVVVAMIAIIMGAMVTSISSAQERARVNKAKAEVKIITQAILAYEKFDNNGKLPTLSRAEANASNLGFLLGNGGTSKTGQSIPTLLMAALQSGGAMRDPWGHPYLVTIRSTGVSMQFKAASQNTRSGYYLPNFYRLNKGERALWSE